MHTNIISFSPDLIVKIVRCVEDAVGDDIQADIQRNDLQTRNSVPARIWDLLNTNVIKTLDTEDCTIAKAHRGPWEMLVIFEKSSQCILTLHAGKTIHRIMQATAAAQTDALHRYDGSPVQPGSFGRSTAALSHSS